MNSPAPPMPAPEAPCPQCGALVAVPYRQESFACPWCGATLRRGEGVLLYRLVQRARVTQAAAEQSVRAWLAGPDLPRDLDEAAAGLRVGTLQNFPFLRQKGQGADRVFPLAPLPFADVLLLAQVPVELCPADGAPVLSGEQAVPADEETLRARLAELARVPDRGDLFLEQRLYFPVAYSYGAHHYTAVVDAGAGAVLAGRRPPRRQVVGEPLLALPAALVLFGLAVLLPSLAGKLVGVTLAAVLLFALARLAVARYG